MEHHQPQVLSSRLFHLRPWRDFDVRREVAREVAGGNDAEIQRNWKPEPIEFDQMCRVTRWITRVAVKIALELDKSFLF